MIPIMVETPHKSKYYYLNSICNNEGKIYHILAGIHTGLILALPEDRNLTLTDECIIKLNKEYKQ